LDIENSLWYASTMATIHRVTFNPKILGGKPIIKGTRITVEFVLELLASGMTEREIVKEYPRLTRTDIRQLVDTDSE